MIQYAKYVWFVFLICLLLLSFLFLFKIASSLLHGRTICHTITQTFTE